MAKCTCKKFADNVCANILPKRNVLYNVYIYSYTVPYNLNSNGKNLNRKRILPNDRGKGKFEETNKQARYVCVCVFVKKERQKICVVKQQNMTT